MDRSLHPNLARVAAAYDEVLLEFQQGRITPNEARRRIVALVARDDNGLEWSIDPDTGKWRYKTHFGGHSLADPPSYGVPSATPADLGSGAGVPSDERVRFESVDLEALRSQGSLSGSTLITPSDVEPPTGSRKRTAVIIAAAMIGAAAATVLSILVL